jgi:hypothetical protein
MPCQRILGFFEAADLGDVRWADLLIQGRLVALRVSLGIKAREMAGNLLLERVQLVRPDYPLDSVRVVDLKML